MGDGEVGFNNIADAFDNYVVAHQARCFIVNALVASFPRLCIVATGTCNKFDATWVREQWNQVASLWTVNCLELVGPLLGHASDGDSRRRKLMLEDYSGRGIPGTRQNLEWEGWQLTHSLTTVGAEPGALVHAYGLHDQDFIHNGKKLVNPLDSTSRILKLGTWVANLSHIIHCYHLYNNNDHGLNEEDIKRTDRQNWASAQQLVAAK